jgi:hypothetical protein
MSPEPEDVGQRAQAAAEAHLAACEEAMCEADCLGEAEVDSPASAPFCGCTTCQVRETLHAAWPIFEEDAEEWKLRLADIAEVVEAAWVDEDTGELRDAGGFLSALDYALRGDPGCIEPEEWEQGRRRALATAISREQARHGR